MNNKKASTSTRELRHILNEYFNESELKDLAFDLVVDYENLPGQSKADKARELVAFLERRGRISELVDMGYRIRPNAPWAGNLAIETSHLTPTKLTSQATAGQTDIFHQYEVGTAHLLAQIGQDHPHYLEGLSYQNRLKENINRTRLHGDSETRRSERSEIITYLNDLALLTIGKPFNELCR